MKEITNQELMNINGGALSAGAILLIVAGIVFVVGVIDGYIRPLKCR